MSAEDSGTDAQLDRNEDTDSSEDESLSVPAKALVAPPAEPLQIVGWREWVSVSLADHVPVRAKIDTGAASSSIHASNIVQTPDPTGRMIASFDLHLGEDRTEQTRVQSHPIVGTRMVLSSSGHWSSRPVVAIGLRLGDVLFDTELTLAARDEMEFRLLIGRSALRKRFCVDPSRSFVQGQPTCLHTTNEPPTQ